MANIIRIGGGSGSTPTLITKSITQNGTYNASSDNADGYSSVVVNVSGGGAEYVDLTSFANYFNRNTTTPTITAISTTEVGLSFTNQNASGYELASFSVPLDKGIYVAEIKATVNKNTGLSSAYMWGIYSSNNTTGAQINTNSPMDTQGYSTYVPFDKSDTSEHSYEVPVKMNANGTAYICFGVAGDNGVNATITVSSLKIRKV